MSRVNMTDLFVLLHPTDVTPMALVETIVKYTDVPAYTFLTMGELYKKTRDKPAFRKARTWSDIHMIFQGEDHEVLDEMAKLVTDTLESVVTQELKQEMHQGYLQYAKSTEAALRADTKKKAEASLAALSDAEAEQLLTSCDQAGFKDVVDELREARFPSKAV